ncbi:MAG: sortase [Actinobacteria bacterium]|nr:sortase [Actinomycetota bacterium]
MAVKKYRARGFRRYKRRKQRSSRMISALALLVVLAGLGLLGYALLGGDSPLLKAFSAAEKKEEVAQDSAAKSKTLKLTIPQMSRVEDLNVYDAPWDDESALAAGAQHVDSTGFPWEDEANVYIAGHRLGFPGTDSYLVFYDLDKLKEGDEVFLTDSDGARYTYEVFKNYVTGPYDWSVTEPVSGKNIVTLQTCTLPDYTERVIVQAELTKVEPAAEDAETLPDEPTQVEQTPVDQAPVESIPEDPFPAAPIPEEPLPAEQAPAGPIPDDQAPIEPLPAGPAQEPDPLPTEQAPVGPPPAA